MIAINNLKCWKSRIPLFIFVLLCMLIAPFPAHANSLPSSSAYTLSASTSSPQVGDSFTVTATANVSELFAFETIFTYDPQRVKLIRADAAANGNLIKPVADEGKIVLAWSKEGNEQPTNGTMRMAELTFNVLKEGETEVLWKSLRIANRSLQEVSVSPGVSLRTNVRAESGSGDVGNVGGVNVPNTVGSGKEPALLALEAAIITNPAQTSQFSVRAVSLTSEPGNHVRVALHVEQVLKEIHSTNGKSTFVIMIPRQESASITVDVASEVLQAIQSKSGGSGSLVISSSVGMYKLPIDQLKLDASSKVTITIAPVSEEQAHAMGTIVANEGFTLAGAPVDFSVSILDASGQVTEMHDYESAFAARTLPAGHMDPDKSAAVLFRADDTLAPVPTLFVKQPDGSYMALIHRMGNSAYGLITGSRTFADLRGHWSKGDIETMAGRLLVNGDTEGRFRPDDAITRAEFAKLLTNALALPDKGDSMTFRDVEPSAWYSRTLLTAVSFGLIKGYDGGVFRPDSFVSREEIAIMLDRALHLTGYQYDSPANFAELLDMDQLNDWSKDAIYKMLGLGIITGDQSNMIQPSQSATRAEAAVMLKRMLIKLSYMNE
ncbi:S-layer homology domain-containing protein [Paenibacillus sp. LjRoot56]|uniref:S-layer homology domain-containing protein n=1 Tax=Paenibacillus sp. LjRoot56 TaxID=3342333 RepID=UPI003ECD4814